MPHINTHQNMAIELSDTFDPRMEGGSLDPFAAALAPQASFVDEFRKLSVNKLIHLAPYCELLYVRGEEGIGKSVLLEQFIANANENWRTAMIQCRSLISEQEFLQEVVDRLDIPQVLEGATSAMLMESVVRFIQSLGRSGRRAILVLDDAHSLPSDILELLEILLSDERTANAFSVILSANPLLDETLAKMTVLRQKLAYTLDFEPFDRSGVQGYIHQRLAASGVSQAGQVFTAEIIDQIYEQSGGVPGRINPLARKVMDRQGLGGTRSFVGSAVRWSVVVVGVAAIGAVLYLQDDINSFLNHGGSNAVVTAKAPVKVEAPAEPVPVLVPEEAPDTLRMIDEPESSKPTPAPVVAEPEAKPVPTPVVAPVPKPVEPEKPAPTPAPAVAKTPPPEPAAAAAPTVAGAQLPGYQWLLDQPGDYYTLQLMALLDEPKVVRFYNKRDLQDRGGVYYIIRSEKRLAAVVYGSYPSWKDAEEAAKTLPASWGVGEPWIRKFSAVRKDMKAAE